MQAVFSNLHDSLQIWLVCNDNIYKKKKENKNELEGKGVVWSNW